MLRRCQTEAEHSLLPDLGCLMLKCGKLGMSEMGLSDLEGLILIFFFPTDLRLMYLGTCTKVLEK